MFGAICKAVMLCAFILAKKNNFGKSYILANVLYITFHKVVFEFLSGIHRNSNIFKFVVLAFCAKFFFLIFAKVICFASI